MDNASDLMDNASDQVDNASTIDIHLINEDYA